MASFASVVELHVANEVVLYIGMRKCSKFCVIGMLAICVSYVM